MAFFDKDSPKRDLLHYGYDLNGTFYRLKRDSKDQIKAEVYTNGNRFERVDLKGAEMTNPSQNSDLIEKLVKKEINALSMNGALHFYVPCVGGGKVDDEYVELVYKDPLEYDAGDGEADSNGQRHGLGVLNREGEFIYKGEFSHGKRHGVGFYYREDKSMSYEGEWKNDQMTGRGELIKKDHGKYTGELFEGKPHGVGRWEGTDSAKYDGEWKHGQRSGHGEMTDSSGNFYRGEWESDVYHGTGKLRQASGVVSEGVFVHGELHDENAKVFFPENERFEGKYERNKMIHGTYYWPHEEKVHSETDFRQKYHGKFNEHEAPEDDDGEFVFFNKVMEKRKNEDGEIERVEVEKRTVFKGNVTAGKPSGGGVLTVENSFVYEGDFSDWLRHGKGKIKFDNGDSYYGQWKEGAIAGQGKFEWATGESYVGEFEDGKPSGRGKSYYKGGQLEFDGTFWDGRPHGRGTLYELETTNPYLYKGNFSYGEFDGEGSVLVVYQDQPCYFEGKFKGKKSIGNGTLKKRSGEELKGAYLDGVFRKL